MIKHEIVLLLLFAFLVASSQKAEAQCIGACCCVVQELINGQTQPTSTAMINPTVGTTTTTVVRTVGSGETLQTVTVGTDSMVVSPPGARETAPLPSGGLHYVCSCLCRR